MTRVEAKQLSEMMLTMGRSMMRLGAALHVMAGAPTKKKAKKKARRRGPARAEFSTF